jgi:hypothetical protein
MILKSYSFDRKVVKNTNHEDGKKKKKKKKGEKWEKKKILVWRVPLYHISSPVYSEEKRYLDVFSQSIFTDEI